MKIKLVDNAKLEDMLHAFSAVFPIHLSLHDPEGHLLAESGERKGDCQLKVPILIKGEESGWLVGRFRPKDRDQGAKVLQLLSRLIAERIYTEFELNSLSEEVLSKYEEINLLFDITEDLGAIFDINQIYDRVLDKTMEALGVERASIMVLDDKGEKLTLVAARGLPQQTIGGFSLKVGEGISGMVIQRGEPLLVEDVSKLPQALVNKSDIISAPMICSPMQVKGKKIGVINATHKISGKMFTTGDLKLLSAIASMAAVSIYNSRLVEALKDSERMKRELEIAESIQKGLLPRQVPRVEGVELAGRCQSAKNVGGDYYDFLQGEDGSLGIIIADVSGHNVGSALMMAIARSVLRSEFLRNGSPAEMLTAANRILFPDMDAAGLFLTLFIANYNPNSKVLRFANAGHNPPFLYRLIKDTFLPLDTEGMVIGVVEEMGFEERQINLHRGDILVFYTDGLIEAVDSKGNRFGIERLRSLVRRNSDIPAEEILNKIYAEVSQYSRDMDQYDDITTVIMKVTG